MGVLGNTPAFKPEVQHAFQEIAREAIAISFSTAILRGIFAGWLIAMMVWILAVMHNTRLPCADRQRTRRRRAGVSVEPCAGGGGNGPVRPELATPR